MLLLMMMIIIIIIIIITAKHGTIKNGSGTQNSEYTELLERGTQIFNPVKTKRVCVL